MYWNLKDIVSAKFGSTSLKLWKLLTIFVIWLLENTFISDLKITLGAAGTVANSLATPIYQYERLVLKYLSIFVAFIEYHSNIVIQNTWVWANTRKAQVFHHSATRKVPETLISLQLKLLNSGKNFDLACLYIWVNLLQWKSVFVGSQFLKKHQKLLLRILSWNFNNENCFQFHQLPETYNCPELFSSVSTIFST